MPQLDITTFLPQIVWLVVTFVAMFLIMWKVAVPRISSSLEARQLKISQNLERAADLKTEAEAALEAYEKALSEARSLAHEEIAAVQADMKAKQEAEEAKLSEILQARVREGEDAINKAMENALAGIEGVATEVAQAACERLIGEPPDDKAIATAVTAATKQQGA